MISAATRTRTADADVSAAATNRLEKVVDHEAIRHNLGVLREAAGGRKVMPVVKGDAYGLGAVPVARTLVAAGADALAVDTVAEGLALRAAGIDHPVLVMDVDLADNAAACLDAGLVPSVARAEHAARYAELAAGRGEPASVWVRTNVGFNRFGPRERFDELLDGLRPYRDRLRFAGLFAHLTSSAWEEEETTTQAAEFSQRLAAARRRLDPQLPGSLAATHGLVHPATLAGTEWVRPGIGLYGTVAPTVRRLPGWSAGGLDRLRPAWRVRARVLDIVTVTRSEGLGYDRTAAVVPGRRVASVATGFSRGITSSAAGFSGLLHGRRCPMVGKPGMDCTQVDVTDVPQAKAGDWLTVIGVSGSLQRSAEDVSAELGCSIYELMATFHMPRRHIGAEPDSNTGTQ